MRAFFRKFAILIAAYALALQPVVAAISVAHAQAGAAFCAASSGGDTPVPAGTHNNNECCLAMGCGASASGAPGPFFSIAPVFKVAAIPFAVAKPAPRIAFSSGWLHAARAPPV